MFFLLPIIAGAAATAISAGEVALGVTAAVGVGAAVKGAIDAKQTNDIIGFSEEKFEAECSKLKNEARLAEKKYDEFNGIKKRINSGILNESMQAITSYGTNNLLRAEQFAENVDLMCETIEDKILDYKILRKQIEEGISLFNYLSEKLSYCLLQLNGEHSIENLHPDKNEHRNFDQIVMFATALKNVLETNSFTTEDL